MPPDDLPELTPEMLCSYGGMKELEGARAMQRMPAPPPPEDAVFQDLAEPERPVFADDNEIRFDRDETLDSELATFRTPAAGARFNVLRPPVREPFRPPPPVPGPQGGPMREVGRVGRFAILTEQDREPPPDYLAEARARLEDRMTTLSPTQQRPTAVELNSRQAEVRAMQHETLPTSYDRLLGDDLFEDDLE